jgi:hypothetical protein
MSCYDGPQCMLALNKSRLRLRYLLHGVIFSKLPRSAHGHRITGEKKPKERSLEQSLLLCAPHGYVKARDNFSTMRVDHRANPNPNAAMIILHRPFSVLRLVQFSFPPSLLLLFPYITCGSLGRHRSRAYPRAPADAPSLCWDMSGFCQWTKVLLSTLLGLFQYYGFSVIRACSNNNKKFQFHFWCCIASLAHAVSIYVFLGFQIISYIEVGGVVM